MTMRRHASDIERAFAAEVMRMHNQASERDARRFARLYFRGCNLTEGRYNDAIKVAWGALGPIDRRKRWRFVGRR